MCALAGAGFPKIQYWYIIVFLNNAYTVLLLLSPYVSENQISKSIPRHWNVRLHLNGTLKHRSSILCYCEVWLCQAPKTATCCLSYQNTPWLVQKHKTSRTAALDTPVMYVSGFNFNTLQYRWHFFILHCWWGVVFEASASVFTHKRLDFYWKEKK